MRTKETIWIGRIVVAVLVIYWLGLVTGTHIPQVILQHQGNDKLLHFGAYAGLALLLCMATAARQTLTWQWFGVLYLLLLGYGMLDELTQIPIPGRQADVLDWLADAFGASFGMFIFGLGYWFWRRSPENPADDVDKNP